MYNIYTSFSFLQCCIMSFIPSPHKNATFVCRESHFTLYVCLNLLRKHFLNQFHFNAKKLNILIISSTLLNRFICINEIEKGLVRFGYLCILYTVERHHHYPCSIFLGLLSQCRHIIHSKTNLYAVLNLKMSQKQYY